MIEHSDYSHLLYDYHQRLANDHKFGSIRVEIELTKWHRQVHLLKRCEKSDHQKLPHKDNGVVLVCPAFNGLVDVFCEECGEVLLFNEQLFQRMILLAPIDGDLRLLAGFKRVSDATASGFLQKIHLNKYN